MYSPSTRKGLPNGRVAGFRRIQMTDNERRRDSDAEHSILSTQSKILGLIATRSSYQEILDSLCLLVEQQSEGAMCSILLVDKDRSRLRAGAGPSIPPEYMAALDGLSIAEHSGSCGSAAFQREPVICTDVERDPEWAQFRDLAARFSIRSCWSTPFFSSTDQVLGTFAISHSYSCAPDPFDYELLQTASYLAGIATENQLLETELIKEQKLESVGVLAGGIAHDFNNLLTSIMGNIELAMARSTPGDDVHGLLSAATTASVRARDVTRQLLMFASGGAPVTSAASVSDLVLETAEFTLAGSNVRCETRFETDIPNVEIDRGQVTQVIQNVLVNAAHAMPIGGVIRVHGRTVSGRGPGAVPAQQGKFVRVSIADDGMGIPREHLRRVFDPYFSTKEKGRGLGLATSHSIMKRHGGWIDLESSLGNGTTFYLYFPVSKGQPRAAAGDVDLPAGTGGTILVMDDEDSVRDVLGSMLTALGYDAAFARDGGEAIALFEARRAEERPFDLVVLDLTVRGGMGGAEALGRLKAIDPGVNAVATSGYANSQIMADHEAHGFIGRLEKPYLVEELKALLLAVMPGGGAKPLPDAGAFGH